MVMIGGMLARHKEGGGNITKHTAPGGAYKTIEGTYVPYYEEQQFVELLWNEFQTC